MSTMLQFGRDVQGYSAEAPQFSTDVYAVTLEPETTPTVTVPSNFSTWIMYVRVQPDGWCWISNGGTATLPSAPDFNASNSTMVVGTVEFKRTVYAGQVISFATINGTCDTVVEFYPISYP